MLVRGVDLHLVDLGAGDPPLVLCHGFTGSDVDWADVQPALAASRRVVSYTHRGHGHSGWSAPYSIADLVADLEVLVDDLGLGTFHLLGHSMGGIVVLEYALGHRARLASLVLMDTTPEPIEGPFLAVMEQLAARVAAEGMAPVVAMMTPFLAGMPPDIAARVEDKLTHMDPAALLDLGRALSDAPSRVGALGELSGLPATVIVGANDLPFLAPSEVLRDGIGGAVLEVIPDAGHSPQEENPVAWLAAVEGHLARARAAGATSLDGGS